MRFMILVKANEDSEAGVLPSKELVATIGRFNDEMGKAGVLLAAEGLQASSKGVRIRFSGDRRRVTEGPFPHTDELLAGFWIIQVPSKEEAIAWASRVPFASGEEIEIRQVFEASDFPSDILPPEDAAREQAWRDQQQQRKA